MLKWVRPPEGNIPIFWRGRNYNPDFIVETADTKYLVEVKEKAVAALRWCQTVSDIPDGKSWEYKLIPDDIIEAANDLKFTVSHAHRFEDASR